MAPITMLSTCNATSAQAIACRRAAFATTKGLPACTVSTMASSRVRMKKLFIDYRELIY